MKFKAEMGNWSSVVGNSVHLIGEDGRFLGQIAIMCQDDRLREKDVQTALCEKICAALNADLCASGQQVRALVWRSAGHDGQSLEASAFGVEVAYRVSGKPGDWTLTSIGMREYIHTRGYQTRANAQAASQVDFCRRILAALTPAPQPEGEAISSAQLVANTGGDRGAIYTGFPQPQRKDGGEPCAECRLPAGETCDICGAKQPDVGKPMTGGQMRAAIMDGSLSADQDAAWEITATPTAQEAVPVAWRSVERKFYRSEWPLAKLLEARNGGLITDEGEAWRYRYTHKDGIGGEYDMLIRREPVAHPPQPSETVAAKALEELLGFARALEKQSSKGTGGRRGGAIFAKAEAALRALKGGET